MPILSEQKLFYMTTTVTAVDENPTTAHRPDDGRLWVLADVKVRV